MKKAFGALALALLASGCAYREVPAWTTAEATRFLIDNRARIFRDPRSSQDVSVGESTAFMGGQLICMQANSANAFGGMTGLRNFVVQVHPSGAVLGVELDTWRCRGPWVRVPELDGQR